jgi:cytochrome c556
MPVEPTLVAFHITKSLLDTKMSWNKLHFGFVSYLPELSARAQNYCEGERTVNMLRLVSTATLLLGLGSGFALADADATIKARQACMKSQGALMGVAVPIMKGEKPFDTAAVAAAFDAQGKACADWANFWTEESMKGGSAETYAKAEIWSDKAGFEKAGNDAYGAMQALKAATDEAGFKAAFPAVGEACKACHDKFRRPKEG